MPGTITEAIKQLNADIRRERTDQRIFHRRGIRKLEKALSLAKEGNKALKEGDTKTGDAKFKESDVAQDEAKKDFDEADKILQQIAGKEKAIAILDRLLVAG